jgi:hypothetical protein
MLPSSPVLGTVKMEANGTYETPVIFRQLAQCHIQEDCILQDFQFSPDCKKSAVTAAPFEQ